MRTEDVHQRQDEWRAFGADGKAVAGTSGLRNDSTAKCLASEHKKPRKKEDSLSIWSIPQDVSIILFLETRCRLYPKTTAQVVSFVEGQ